MPYIKTTCKAGKTKEYEFYYSYRFDQKGGSRKKKENRTPRKHRDKSTGGMAEKKTHPIDERQPFRGGLLPYTQLPEREAAGSGDIEPGHPNTFAKTAEDLPETRKRTEIHMDGGKRERGAAHLHIVVNGIDHISHIIRDLWEKGWICIKPLDKSGQYRKLAGYFIKYSDKTMKTEQGFINKRYCSR